LTEAEAENFNYVKLTHKISTIYVSTNVHTLLHICWNLHEKNHMPSHLV